MVSNYGIHLSVRPVTPLAGAPPHITPQGGAQGAYRSRPAGDAGRWTDTSQERVNALPEMPLRIHR
jgi:hypothetical protein